MVPLVVWVVPVVWAVTVVRPAWVRVWRLVGPAVSGVPAGGAGMVGLAVAAGMAAARRQVPVGPVVTAVMVVGVAVAGSAVPVVRPAARTPPRVRTGSVVTAVPVGMPGSAVTAVRVSTGRTARRRRRTGPRVLMAGPVVPVVSVVVGVRPVPVRLGRV